MVKSTTPCISIRSNRERRELEFVTFSSQDHGHLTGGGFVFVQAVKFKSLPIIISSIMSGYHPDPRTNKAVDLLRNETTLTVPKAMRAAGFSLEESRDRAKQMWVRRRIPSKKVRRASLQPPPSTLPQSTRSPVQQDNPDSVTGSVRNVSDQLLANEIGWNCDGNELDDAFECALQDWIACHCDETKGHNGNTSLDVYKRRIFLEQWVQITHSLAEKIVRGFDGDISAYIGQPDLITAPNVIVRTSLLETILGHKYDGQVLSADFITKHDDSPFCYECNVDETQNKYAAMHAFARIAYTICLRGKEPKLPDFIVRSEMSNLTLRDDSNGNAGEEDDIMDMISKHLRVAESIERNDSGFITAMSDAGIPLPVRRFIIDLLGDEHGGMFRSAHAFTSFEDVLSDLKQMMMNPDRFLHGTSTDGWKIVFDEKLYGRDDGTDALMIAADRVLGARGEVEMGDRRSRLSRKKSEVVMVSGHSGAGKSRLVRVGGACLERRGWLFLQCKFDRVGEFKTSIPDGPYAKRNFYVDDIMLDRCPSSLVSHEENLILIFCSCMNVSHYLNFRYPFFSFSSSRASLRHCQCIRQLLEVSCHMSQTRNASQKFNRIN